MAGCPAAAQSRLRRSRLSRPGDVQRSDDMLPPGAAAGHRHGAPEADATAAPGGHWDAQIKMLRHSSSLE